MFYHMPRFHMTALSVLAVIGLSACQSAPQGAPGTSNMAGQQTQVQAKDSLPVIESLYKRDSENPDLARRYARALRENGRAQRANIVLAPFAEAKNPTAGVITEYGAIHSALGQYDAAEQYARRAIGIAPESGEAWQVLGIALEAQGHHQQAEVAFRKALDFWQGNPAAVLNNLGLNLATQGFFDEAVDSLRRASGLAPDRKEIERNLRIVSALQQQNPALAAANVPVPNKKPGASE